MPVSKPTDLARWADVGGTISVPAEGKKDIGWTTNEQPPSGVFNWLFNRAHQWFAYLDDLHSQTMAWTAAHTFGSTVGVTGLLTANGDIVVPARTPLVVGSGVGGAAGFTSGDWGSVGGKPLGYYKDSLGFVCLEGWVQCLATPSVGPPSRVFTLPFAPPVSRSFPVVIENIGGGGGGGGTTAIGRVDVDASGHVELGTSAVGNTVVPQQYQFWCFDGVRFRD